MKFPSRWLDGYSAYNLTTVARWQWPAQPARFRRELKSLTGRLAIRTVRIQLLADAASSVNAAFCCLAEFRSPLERMRKLVGAVGIENNADWNFKDLL
jgi:hypothetical protein